MSKTNLLKERFEESTNINANNNRDIAKDKLSSLIEDIEILDVDTSNCDEWEYANRDDFEMGNLDELSKSIKNNGQIQPALVVPSNSLFKGKKPSTNAKYIIIAGRRRFKSCQLANLKYKVIVKHGLSLEEAIEIQRVENSDRKDISDYSEGTSIYAAIKDNKTTFSEIVKKSSLSKAMIGRLLAYGRILDDYPNLAEAIGSMRNIPSSSAAEILRLANKGHVDSLISISKNLKKGIGHRKINQLISKTDIADKIYSDGVLIMTLANNRITIPKSIYTSNKEELISSIKETILNHMNKQGLAGETT